MSSLLDIDEQLQYADDFTLQSFWYEWIKDHLDSTNECTGTEYLIVRTKAIQYSSDELQCMRDLNIQHLPLEMYPFISYESSKFDDLMDFLSKWTDDSCCIYLVVKDNTDLNSIPGGLTDFFRIKKWEQIRGKIDELT